MTDTVGQCTRIEVLQHSGKVWVQPAGTTSPELFLLWFFIGTRDIVTNEDISAFDRVRHSMWVAMLQRAMDSGQPVTITHDDAGAFCRAVKVGT